MDRKNNNRADQNLILNGVYNDISSEYENANPNKSN
jgi:hypothetical protein